MDSAVWDKYWELLVAITRHGQALKSGKYWAAASFALTIDPQLIEDAIADHVVRKTKQGKLAIPTEWAQGILESDLGTDDDDDDDDEGVDEDGESTTVWTKPAEDRSIAGNDGIHLKADKTEQFDLMEAGPLVVTDASKKGKSNQKEESMRESVGNAFNALRQPTKPQQDAHAGAIDIPYEQPQPQQPEQPQQGYQQTAQPQQGYQQPEQSQQGNVNTGGLEVGGLDVEQLIKADQYDPLLKNADSGFGRQIDGAGYGFVSDEQKRTILRAKQALQLAGIGIVISVLAVVLTLWLKVAMIAIIAAFIVAGLSAWGWFFNRDKGFPKVVIVSAVSALVVLVLGLGMSFASSQIRAPENSHAQTTKTAQVVTHYEERG